MNTKELSKAFVGILIFLSIFLLHYNIASNHVDESFRGILVALGYASFMASISFIGLMYAFDEEIEEDEL